MSLLTLKYLFEQAGLTPLQLMEKYRIRKGRTENFELTRTVSVAEQVSKKKVTKSSIDNIVKCISQTRKANKKRVKPQNGAVVALARSLELSDGDKMHAIVQKIAFEGLQYTAKLGKCTIYIYDGNDEKDMREEYLDGLIEKGKNIQRVSVREFLAE
jgi:hypothetical protein